MSAAVSTPSPSEDVRPVRRALVSVHDKTGLDDLARGLHTNTSTSPSAASVVASATHQLSTLPSDICSRRIISHSGKVSASSTPRAGM